MCQLMIQCKAAIKAYLVAVCFTVVTAEGHVIVDVYKIFEHCLLPGLSLPRYVFQPYPWHRFYRLYFGNYISKPDNVYMIIFYTAKAILSTCSKNSVKVSNLWSICVDLVDICQKWKGLLTCPQLHKRFLAQQKMEKETAVLFAGYPWGYQWRS